MFGVGGSGYDKLVFSASAAAHLKAKGSASRQHNHDGLNETRVGLFRAPFCSRRRFIMIGIRWADHLLELMPTFVLATAMKAVR